MQPISVFTADGNISPACFVKISTASNNRVLQAGANDELIGVSQKGTRRTPYPGLNDGYAAIQGEGLGVFLLGQTAPLLMGGTVTAGDRLKSDANGNGVTASTGDHYGAITPMSAIAGQIVECQVQPGTL